MTQKLTIVLFKEGTAEGTAWVAQCLEHDIAAQGDTIDEALDAFEAVLTGQIIADHEAGREPLSGIAPAPDYYFEHFRRAHPLAEATPFRISDGVPPSWRGAVHPQLRVF